MLSARKCVILSRFAFRLENCFSQGTYTENLPNLDYFLGFVILFDGSGGFAAANNGFCHLLWTIAAIWTHMSIQARQRFENAFAPERVREKWLKVVG